MDVMKLNLRTIILGVLSAVLWLSPARAQDKPPQFDQKSDAPPVISTQEKIDLYPKLQSAEAVAIVANNFESAGMAISHATVKAVKREAGQLPANDGAPTFVTDYVAQINLTFRNTTDGKITGVRLKFTNSETRSLFNLYANKIEIEKAQEAGYQVNFMALAGNPARLSVEITGVRFDTIWKSVPLSPATAKMERPAIDNPRVDIKPQPLNNLRPRYTELARNNGIVGSVRLQITIGADGVVNKVAVINALPDGLTEEAIHIARVLQFKPAMAGGAPVEYAIMLDIEFVQV
jgi:TonB family protein